MTIDTNIPTSCNGTIEVGKYYFVDKDYSSTKTGNGTCSVCGNTQATNIYEFSDGNKVTFCNGCLRNYIHPDPSDKCLSFVGKYNYTILPSTPCMVCKNLTHNQLKLGKELIIGICNSCLDDSIVIYADDYNV